MKAKNAINEILNEKWNYGGILTPLWAIMKDLEKKGLSKRDANFYCFCLTNHQRKEG